MEEGTRVVEKVPRGRLAGGFQEGDRVRSLFAHDKVGIGDVGTVTGPSSNQKAADQADRVNVDFGSDKGQFNFIAKSQIEHVRLAGGFQKGDRVRSLFSHGTVGIVDVGTVTGPCSDSGLWL